MIKKAVSMPQDLVLDITNTFSVVKSNLGTLNYIIVPLHAIEFDPENPRALEITREDIVNGLSSSDPFFNIKAQELESLQQMAETIKKYGVRNAIEIYKNGSNYRLIHGERRCLASLLAGKDDIAAKVLDQKPSMLDLRLLQLIENAQREDLTLLDFIKNIRVVIEEYKNANDNEIIIDASFLEKLINKSRAQCFNILNILNAPEDLRKLIDNGSIKSLEKAAVIASEKDTEKRQQMLKACVDGASIRELRNFKQELKKNLYRNVAQLQEERKNLKKAVNKIYLGQTKNKSVISRIINLVLKDPSYSKYVENFSGTNFKSFDSCSVAFKQLISIMEKIEND